MSNTKQDTRSSIEKLTAAGKINVSDGWAFVKIADIANAMGARKIDGTEYAGIMKGSVPFGNNKILWFAILPTAENIGPYSNILTTNADGTVTILEKEPEDGLGPKVELDWNQQNANRKHGKAPHAIVFGKKEAKNRKGYYRFQGVFELIDADLVTIGKRWLLWKHVSETADVMK